MQRPPRSGVAFIFLAAASAAAEPFHFGGKAGRDQLLKDGNDLDAPADINLPSWPSRSKSANVAKPEAALLRRKEQSVSASSGDAWARMQGLVDGIVKDGQSGIQDPAVGRAIATEKQQKQAQLADEAEKVARLREVTRRRDGIVQADALEIDAAKAAIKVAPSSGAKPLSWDTVAGTVMKVANSNAGYKHMEWEKAVDTDLSALKNQAADAFGTLDQERNKLLATAKSAKTHYDEIRGQFLGAEEATSMRLALPQVGKQGSAAVPKKSAHHVPVLASNGAEVDEKVESKREDDVAAAVAAEASAVHAPIEANPKNVSLAKEVQSVDQVAPPIQAKPGLPNTHSGAFGAAAGPAVLLTGLLLLW